MRYVVGIDEVGRGPLAGPVVLAAVAIPRSWRFQKGKDRVSLKDSKKLTEIQRERWVDYLREHPKVTHVIVKAYPKTIDEMNIARAANLAARRALRKLVRALNLPSGTPVYLDGGLYLRKLRHSREHKAIHTEPVRLSRELTLIARTIVKGDEKVKAISIASVFAKVHRDSLMRREAKKYPGYGFERHKGYGTKAHYAAIRQLGPTPIHRLTFI
jgi:ribonuclease HII